MMGREATKWRVVWICLTFQPWHINLGVYLQYNRTTQIFHKDLKSWSFNSEWIIMLVVVFLFFLAFFDVCFFKLSFYSSLPNHIFNFSGSVPVCLADRHAVLSAAPWAPVARVRERPRLQAFSPHGGGRRGSGSEEWSHSLLVPG